MRSRGSWYPTLNATSAFRMGHPKLSPRETDKAVPTFPRRARKGWGTGADDPGLKAPAPSDFAGLAEGPCSVRGAPSSPRLCFCG
jgi:hypothetical protein